MLKENKFLQGYLSCFSISPAQDQNKHRKWTEKSTVEPPEYLRLFLLCYLGWDDALHTALEVAFKHMGLGQLFVPMGRQPDLGQRPTFTEDKVGVEHCPASPGSHAHPCGIIYL